MMGCCGEETHGLSTDDSEHVVDTSTPTLPLIAQAAPPGLPALHSVVAASQNGVEQEGP